MESRKIVITTMITILIISIVLSIIGWNTRDYDSRFSDQECKRSGNYCVFNGIPTGMMYSKPSESIGDAQEFQGNLGDYLYNIRYNSEIEYPPQITKGNGDILVAKRIPTPIMEITFWDIDSYRCNSTDEQPVIIDYFSEFCGSSTRIGGCGNERIALVCGDIYLIQDTNDYRSKIYGPFDTPQLI